MQAGWTAPPLRIPLVLREAMRVHMQACLPAEGCGFLAGSAERFREYFPARNQSTDNHHFIMDRSDLIRIIYTSRDKGYNALVLVHSHPHGPAQPSPADLAATFSQQSLHLLWVPDPQKNWSVQAFQLTRGNVTSLPVIWLKTCNNIAG